jgi:Tol biopolymer transport system component/tRNA A-37 threonylcarbamoyl transferase component Bud32
LNTLDRLTTSLADRYRLDRELGQGGMATVYLAEDLKHGRKVAIKVLHPELSAVIGGDRFLTEIKTTASLQHPHILGLIDSGEADGLLYYVMPFIEGETLRARLTREKQLPVEDAIRLTREVASALEFAHKRGIVHRDIKPENILLQDGQALVADFGIALAVQQAGGSRMTQTGMSLGTPAYMSPEQAMGERELGARSDVYALGAMTYEMLTGEPPFMGPNSQAIVAKVLTEPPRPLRLSRPAVSPAVEHAVLRALEKLPADRFNSAKDYAEALDGKGNYASTVVTSRPHVLTSLGSRPSRLTRPVMLAALALTATAAGLTGWLARGSSRAEAPAARYGLAFPAAQVPRGMFALTPDAARLVYAGPSDSGQQLWVKERDQYEATPLAGTGGTSSPTVSPDGKWVAFVQKGQLKKIPITGGAATTLADSAFASGGLAWLDDGSVVYTTPDVTTLMRVPEQGGISTVAWKPDSVGLYSVLATPLPDARGVLFNSCTDNCVSSDLWVLDLKSGHAKPLVPGVLRGWYLPTGHLAYIGRDGQMFAALFDLKTLAIRGTPVPVLAGIALNGGIVPRVTISSNGTLVMQAGGRIGGLARYQMVWVDRAGVMTPVDTAWTFSVTQSGANVGWALSPDGSRLAIGLNTSSGDDIWIKQLPTGPLSRLTLDSIAENRPRWTPDGQSVTYLINATTLHVLRERRADGTGADATRLDLQTTGIPEGSWSPDGKWLVLRTGGVQGQRGARDILGIRPGLDSAPVPLVADPRYDEAAPMLSPDGKWLAYESDETGKTEVYVRPFPNTEGGKWQVSVTGGQAPLWARSGKEIFFVDGARNMVAAPVLPGAAFQLGERRTLFRLGDDLFLTAQEHYTPFDITPDDKRFIMAREVRTATEAAPTFLLVENWFTELKSRMATK